MIQLIVGLGNPGLKYSSTRHNIGQMLIEALMVSTNTTVASKHQGVFGLSNLGKEKILLAYPTTFMNLSGECVGKMATFYKILPEDILVIHDELDLPFGAMHLKKGGGLAGHNGLKSIKAHLQTDNFYRMRLGIGRPINGQSVSDWVLSPFSQDERIQLTSVLEDGMKAIVSIIDVGWDKSCQLYSRK